MSEVNTCVGQRHTYINPGSRIDVELTPGLQRLLAYDASVSHDYLKLFFDLELLHPTKSSRTLDMIEPGTDKLKPVYAKLLKSCRQGQ